MKKKILSLVLLLSVALSAFSACTTESETNSSSSSSSPAIEQVDYVAQTKLDLNSSSMKIEIVPTANDRKYTHIDGDTTHFQVDRSIDDTGKIKARYLGVDTPESTGDIEEWGKKASQFTKDSLASASSIILEADGDQWTFDTNGRYLCWVWYKPAGSEDYRLLNLELLQEGLAVESKTSNSRYGVECGQAAAQALALKLYVHSEEKDPDFYYGDAIVTSLKNVRLNADEFVGKRVSIEAYVTTYEGKGSIYIEEYVEEDNRTYGFPVFYGMNKPSYDPILAPGNFVRIVGEVSNSETFGYQISGLYYDYMDPDNSESIKCFSKNNDISSLFTETTAKEFAANDYQFAKDYLYGSVCVKNLRVVDTYTTNNGGDSDGAMTLTCKGEDGTEIEIRTGVLYDNNGKITADRYMGKTIDVIGIAEYFKLDYQPTGTYQIEVYSASNITIHE